MLITQIKPNPNNPRIIKDNKFKQLVKSIQDFPQMLELRPIVIDENNIVLWKYAVKGLSRSWVNRRTCCIG